MTVRTLHGSCHCGAVRFELTADPEQGTGRCTCTFCTKTGLWSIRANPVSSFKLLSGGDQLGDYSRSSAGHHRFCRTCGLWTFTQGNLPNHGGDYVTVNVRALDEDLGMFEGTPVRYVDGRANTWAPLKTEPYHNPVPPSKGPPKAYGEF